MSEDRPLYRCSNEIKPHRVAMDVDCDFATVVTWQVVGNVEHDTLSWRFVTNEGKVVVVRPLQIPSNERPLCVPVEIGSALREIRDLVKWVRGWGTLPRRNGAILTAGGKMSATAERAEMDALVKAAEAADVQPYLEAFNKALAVEAEKLAKGARRERQNYTGKHLPKPSPDDMKRLVETYIEDLKGAVEGVDSDHPNTCSEYHRKLKMFVREKELEKRKADLARMIEADRVRIKALIEEDKAAKVADDKAKSAEIDSHKAYVREVALFEINRFAERMTGKPLVKIAKPGKDGKYTKSERAAAVKLLTGRSAGAVALEQVRKFIAEEVGAPSDKEMMTALDKGSAIAANVLPSSRQIRDYDLRRVLASITKEVKKADLRGPVLKAHGKRVRDGWGGWVADIMAARNLKKPEAEQFLIERTKLIAECDVEGGGFVYPIEAVTLADVMDETDAAAYKAAGGIIAVRGGEAEPRTRGEEATGPYRPSLLDSVSDGSLQYDTKQRQVLRGGKPVKLHPVLVAIVEETAIRMGANECNAEKRVDMTDVCDKLKRDKVIKSGWPCKSGIVAQFFRLKKAYKMFGEMFGKVEGKGETVGGKVKRHEWCLPRFEVI